LAWLRDFSSTELIIWEGKPAMFLTSNIVKHKCATSGIINVKTKAYILLKR